MSRRIEIVVPRKGISTGQSQIRVEASGYIGGTCKTVTDALMQNIGGERDEQLKQEFFETEQGVERIHDGGGHTGG